MPTEDHSSDRSDQGVPQGGGVDLSLDELAKGLATGTLSRGKALRLMGAALVGGALASIPGTAWAARCPSPRIRCRGQCCPTPVTTCVGTGGNKTCGPCPNGTEDCGGTCTDLSTTTNCGTCGNACVPGAICVSGECQCPTGTTLCGGSCVSNVCFEDEFFNPNPGRCRCEALCDPPCPDTCGCSRSGDGSGNVCTSFGGGNPTVSRCDECPTADAPEHTVCVDLARDPNFVLLACERPCPQQT
jgi:hypothetical protein